VIALFTAALSAQKAASVVRAGVTVVAPSNVQSEGPNAGLPEWLKLETEFISM
jgi:hypothetical protein